MGEMMMLRNLLIACVHAAVITDACFDPEENEDFLNCAKELQTIYYDCINACPDPLCMSRCNRDYEYSYKNCPCQENCATGCPCDFYVCQTTTVKTTETTTVKTTTRTTPTTTKKTTTTPTPPTTTFTSTITSTTTATTSTTTTPTSTTTTTTTKVTTTSTTP